MFQFKHKNTQPLKRIIHSNETLKKIVNVYQLKYQNDKSSGFGDYLRGCFCLIQICNLNNIEFDMDLSNHPIARFIEINNNQYECIDRTYILRYKNKEITMNHLIDFMSNNSIGSTTCFLFCNNLSLYNNYTEPSKNFIKSKIMPNSLMNVYITNEMNELNLISGHFSVVHIRTGDEYLLQNMRLNKKYVYKILNYILPNLKQDKKYLILSDNNEIKLYFKKLNNCVFTIKPIIHFSDSIIITDDNVKNTLLDFYLMSKSSEIYSITPYDHGSGFSEWCSVVYNIPFKQQIIPNLNLKQMCI